MTKQAVDEWDRLVTFFDSLRGHWYIGDSAPGTREKERMMFSADVVRMAARKFRARARASERRVPAQ